jgi:hypothetical protein
VDVLNRGSDDFSPFVMYFDDPALSPPGSPLPHIAMDQTFFPMYDGTRTVFKIKMAPGKYFNLVYTWGWRAHPPRVQVIENAMKMMSVNGQKRNLVDWEKSVFGEAPRAGEDAKMKAISMIGELSPAKRMWTAMRAARDAATQGDYKLVVTKTEEATAAYFDWVERTDVPKGVTVDPDSDLTLLYVDNTIYGQFKDGGRDFPAWKLRGTTFKVTVYNGDHFDHAYQNVDFGGARGWENQFQSSVSAGGSGCWFTFGRTHWWMNIPNTSSGDLAVVVPAAGRDPYKPGVHKVQLTFNYEPNRRLRFYQFDPLHHDVAIFSIH